MKNGRMMEGWESKRGERERERERERETDRQKGGRKGGREGGMAGHVSQPTRESISLLCYLQYSSTLRDIQ